MSVFLVLALVSQLVLWCVIAWSRVRLSVGYWLFCCVLDFPLLCDLKNNVSHSIQYYYYYYYYYYYLCD